VCYKGLLLDSKSHTRSPAGSYSKRALELGAPPRLLLKDSSDLYTFMTLTAWSASVGGEKSETAPLRYAGKSGRPRYPPVISPDAGTRVHYDRALTDQHPKVRICANLTLHGILSPLSSPRISGTRTV